DREEPPLPSPRGPLSAAVRDHLRGTGPLPRPETAAAVPAWGDDLQLALYQCYELHYRGFAEVDPGLEWDPGLLR
ncbi:iron-containing redox enzyme family protein, partial [Streptomyces sp. TRM76130]|nr:iron-containing redox enzyme family protein [Streptomyces sp. TRM76130]